MQTDIGEGTRVWQFVVILAGAKVGSDCNLCAHTFVEGGAVIGNGVTIKSGVHLWNGITLEDDVFVGPNAVFTNDAIPRSHRPFKLLPTTVRRGASIGAGAVILPGLEIGEDALVGAGAIVTKSVPAGETWVGNPARKLEK